MRLLALLLLSFASAAIAQTSPGSSAEATESVNALSAQDQTPSTPEQNSSSPGQAAQGNTEQTTQEQNHSVLDVQPGTEALKEKDLYEASGYLHPFRRMPKFVLTDQRRIWTSPLHTSRSDMKWWLIFGGATAGLIAADQHIAKAAPHPSSLVQAGNDVSYLGTAYTLIPIAGTFYLIGNAGHDERFRETGLLSFETLVDVTVVQLAVKSITDRERPNEGQGEGHFFASTSPRYNSSFPSGHAIETFALASILAHEYHDKFWVKFLAYLYAGGVVGARLAANQHFPGDVMAGGAIGWFIGDYVYGKRHNPNLDPKRGAIRRVLAHVEVGGLAP